MAADIDEPTVLLRATMSYIGGYLPFVLCVLSLLSQQPVQFTNRKYNMAIV